MMKRYPVIGVIGSHEDKWDRYSAPLGNLIAKIGAHLLTGAGGGVMTAVAKAFTENRHRKGFCIGIIPVEKVDDYEQKSALYPNPYVEIPITTQLAEKSMVDRMPFSRNIVNILSSDVIVALPGYHGTKNEVGLSLMFDTPIILFGPEPEFEKFPQNAKIVEKIESVEDFIKDNI